MEFPNLEKTPFWKAFSEKGRSIFQPNGIFYWAGRAKREAEIIGTIGSIMGNENELAENGKDRFIHYYIPTFAEYLGKDPLDAVPYAPISGLPDFRTAWKKWIIRKGKNAGNLPGGPVDVSDKITDPAVVPGITFAIYAMTSLFVSPGEEMVCPNKRWGNYDSIITRNCGVKIKSFPMFTEDKKFNIDAMTKAMEETAERFGKVPLILNFPNNPTGYVPDVGEAAAIIDAIISVADNKNVPVIVLCDDAYEGYVYSDKGLDASLFYTLTARNHPNIIPVKMDGASKEFLLYGGRVAAITFGLASDWLKNTGKDGLLSELENKVQAIIRSTVSNSNRFMQTIMAKLISENLEKALEERKKIIEIIGKRYGLINKLLAEIEKETGLITVDPNAGGFFLFINLDPSIPADKFNEYLLTEYKTGLIPSVKKDLGINGLRIAYSSIPVETIPALVENLKNALKTFGKR